VAGMPSSRMYSSTEALLSKWWTLVSLLLVTGCGVSEDRGGEER
jgi:hypothetical protein